MHLLIRNKVFEIYEAKGLNDIRIIRVWGMGGIGKTTLTRVVYKMIFNNFEGGGFITNIEEES